MKKKTEQWSVPFRYTVGVLIFAALVAFLIYAHEAVKMLIIAAFTAYLISPAVTFMMERTKLTRAAAGVLCSHLQRRIEGGLAGGRDFRRITELGAALAESGWAELHDLETDEILMKY